MNKQSLKQLHQFWYEGQEDLLKNHRSIYKYIDAASCIKILENRSLAFRNPLSFNDPFEFSLNLIDFSTMSEADIREVVNDCYSFLNRKDRRQLWEAGKTTLLKTLSGELEKLMKLDIEHHGVSCFSAEYDHLLLWSHYAKSHTGVCIGFDMVELFYIIAQDSHPERLIRKVDYRDELLPFPYMKGRQEATIRWMTTKSKVWDYEKEIRIILSFLKFNKEHLHFQKINKESFQTIYLGSQIQMEDAQSIREICKANYPHIKIYSMQLAGNQFKLLAT